MASGPSERHVGRLIKGHCRFLQGELALRRRAHTQLGTGDRARRLLRTVAGLFPPRNPSAWSWLRPPKERPINCRPGEGENCMQMGKIMSIHLTKLSWPGPSPPQALVEPLPHHLWSFLQRQVSCQMTSLPGRQFKYSQRVWAWKSHSAWGAPFKLCRSIWICSVIETQGACCHFSMRRTSPSG